MNKATPLLLLKVHNHAVNGKTMPLLG